MTAYRCYKLLKILALCSFRHFKSANVTQEGPIKQLLVVNTPNPLIKFGKSARLEMQDALGNAEAIEAFVVVMNNGIDMH